MAEQVTWAQLDPYGQVTGTPYTGDVEGLERFARKDVADLAKFSREDTYPYYHHPTGRVVQCTMVAMDLPWGRYRFIPAEATTMPPLSRRWIRQKPWPR